MNFGVIRWILIGDIQILEFFKSTDIQFLARLVSIFNHKLFYLVVRYHPDPSAKLPVVNVANKIALYEYPNCSKPYRKEVEIVNQHKKAHEEYQ